MKGSRNQRIKQSKAQSIDEKNIYSHGNKLQELKAFDGNDQHSNNT